MAKIAFQVETPLAPAEVMHVLTDFSEHRAEVWSNIDAAHFKVHSLDAVSADVTEGNSLAGGIWERERYEWDAAAGRIAVVTTESNTWGPGSRWDYQLIPRANGGTQVEVHVVRNGKGFKGKVLELVLGLAGSRRLRGDLRRVLTAGAAG